MTGESDLKVLLGSMEPIMGKEEYVFCTVQDYEWDLRTVWAMIREDEGMTLILDRLKADSLSLSYDSVFMRITLNIHSSLDAVGLTAAVSTKLSERDISANVVAAYFHDHIFIQKEKATQAMVSLNELVQANK